jgi:hypothetical protein
VFGFGSPVRPSQASSGLAALIAAAAKLAPGEVRAVAETKINLSVARQGWRVVVSFSETISYLALSPADAGQLAVALAHFAAADDEGAELAEVLELLKQIGKPNPGGPNG